MTWLLSQSFYQWIVSTERLNASWYLIALESTVSSKDCIRRVIDFQISFRYTTCPRLDRLFVTIKRLSRQHDCFLINCFIKKIIFAKRWMSERVMILDAKLFESIVSFDRIVRKTKSESIARFVRDLTISVSSSMSMFCSWCMSFKCLF